MSQSNQLAGLANLVRIGFDAVGSRVDVHLEDQVLIIRDLIVQVDDRTLVCCSAFDDTSQLFSFPVTARENAATKIVVHVLQGLVSRAIERGNH